MLICIKIKALNSTWPWQRREIWSGKAQKVLLVVSTRRTDKDNTFSFACFSSVSNPPKVSNMEIRVLSCKALSVNHRLCHQYQLLCKLNKRNYLNVQTCMKLFTLLVANFPLHKKKKN